MAIGITVDRVFSIALVVWMILAILSTVLWLRFFSIAKYRIAAIVVLFLSGTLAGSWHHIRWQLTSPLDISLFADTQPRPATIRGVITTQPKWIISDSQWDRFERPRGPRSRFTLKADSIRDQANFVKAAGLVEMFVGGQVSGFAVGDRVQIHGRISTIGSPTNPGQFDFKTYFRGKAKHSWMFVAHPDCITPIDCRAVGISPQISRLRISLNNLIWKYLSNQQAPLASAMLLGNRQQLDQMQ